jgi:hypothetical protein
MGFDCDMPLSICMHEEFWVCSQLSTWSNFSDGPAVEMLFMLFRGDIQ